MRQYSILDYSYSKQCIADRDLIDQFGNPMFNDEFIAECQKIISFFKSIYDKARSYVGDWACRIKLAWSSLKDTATKVVNKVTSKVYPNAIVLPDGSLYIQDTKVRPSGEMRLRGSRNHYLTK